jgi:hypothetical protein
MMRENCAVELIALENIEPTPETGHCLSSMSALRGAAANLRSSVARRAVSSKNQREKVLKESRND